MMSAMLDNFQHRVKDSANGLGLFSFKILSGAIVGLTFALIGEVMVGYGTFSFMLVFLVVLASLWKISKGWKWVGILVFDLICVLVALLLRMYILIAPGA
jgi:hypothetical protein